MADRGEGQHPTAHRGIPIHGDDFRHARTAAITASIKGALSLMSGLFAGKPVPTAKHHAT